MTKIVKRAGSLLSCLLAVLLLFGSAARAEGLLEAMTDIALKGGRTIEGTLRIEAGDLLAALGMSPEGSGEYAPSAAIDLLNNGLLRVRYSQVGEQKVTGIVLELKDETVFALDMRTLDGEIALETSLLPGKTLIVPADFIAQSVAAQAPVSLDDDWMEALGSVATRYATAAGNWAAQNEGVISVSNEPVSATRTRDAAAHSTTLRVTGAQWQELLRSLAEEFAKDDALQQALAVQLETNPAELSAAVRQLVDSFDAPQGNVVEATVFLSEEDLITGIDVTVEPPVATPADAPKPLHGKFTYGHLSIDDSHAADSYEASFAWGDGYELQAQFFRRDGTPSEPLPGQSEQYGGRALIRTQDTGALELEVSGESHRAVEPINEAYDHTFDVRLVRKAESTGTGDLVQLLQAPLLEAGFALSSQTEVVGIEDFRSWGSFMLTLMGQEAAVHYTLESFAYTPAEHPENTVVRLDKLTSAETDALMRDLMENQQGLLGSPNALSERPPALQAYTVDDESVPSIDSVVGFREIINSEAGSSWGNPYVQVNYQADNVKGDAQAYVDFLLDNGWVITKMEGDIPNGELELAAESASDGKVLIVTIKCSDTYSIRLRKTGGTLTRYTDEAGNDRGKVTETN